MKRTYTYILQHGRIIISLILVSIMSGIYGQTSHYVSVINYAYDPVEITINAGDTIIWSNIEGSHNVNGNQSVFPNNPESFGNNVSTNWTFSHVFLLPGIYDYQCDPHVNFNMFGKVIVQEVLPDTLTVNFTGMTPHVGQNMYLNIVDEGNNEVFRVSVLAEESFTIIAPIIYSGRNYTVNFYTDHNNNGSYDAPPVDHAWSIALNEVSGNETLDFSHNTEFTNIDWKLRLAVHFSGMTPHIGQKLNLYLRNSSDIAVDSVVLYEIMGAEFEIVSYEMVPGESYTIDFYSDHNGNGVYDAPPTDHAWRLFLDEVMGDVELEFVHNTEFTDIEAANTTGVDPVTLNPSLILYPNPSNGFISIRSNQNIASVEILSTTGAQLLRFDRVNAKTGVFDLHGIEAGIYLFSVKYVTGEMSIIKVMKY